MPQFLQGFLQPHARTGTSKPQRLQTGGRSGGRAVRRSGGRAVSRSGGRAEPGAPSIAEPPDPLTGCPSDRPPS